MEVGVRSKARAFELGGFVAWLAGGRSTSVWGGLFADVSLHYPFTLLAGDVAAPVVLAVAALHQFLGVGVVAPPTAHQVTAVAAHRRLVALPGSRGERGRRGLETMAAGILKTQLIMLSFMF